jgi:hypothetical protein
MMGEEFYSIIKLISGEEIFSLVCIDENDGDPIIILQNPVVMKPTQGPGGGSFVKIKPWIDLSDEDFFMIKLDKIITMTESRDKKLIEVYDHYLQNDSIDSYVPGGKVKVTDQMGYIGSVEDSRKSLEDIFKGIKEI